MPAGGSPADAPRRGEAVHLRALRLQVCHILQLQNTHQVNAASPGSCHGPALSEPLCLTPPMSAAGCTAGRSRTCVTCVVRPLLSPAHSPTTSGATPGRSPISATCAECLSPSHPPSSLTRGNTPVSMSFPCISNPRVCVCAHARLTPKHTAFQVRHRTNAHSRSATPASSHPQS